ncbi:hypothetical protein MMC14_002484 [Varicellaria rhodocarpa]|nr:hypothetical protein [Varicellaria rhodocarpa]
MYEEVCLQTKSVQADLERTRFDSWVFACVHSQYDSSNDCPGKWIEDFNYSFATERLGQVQAGLRNIIDGCKNLRSPIFQPLHQLNNLLLNHLNGIPKVRAQTWLDMQVMRIVSNLHIVPQPSGIDLDDARVSLAHKLSMFAAIKSVIEVSQERLDHEALISSDQLKEIKRVGDFKISCFTDNSWEAEERVIVESKTYQAYHGDKGTATELHERLENITMLLKEANNAAGEDDFRVLPCGGFFQDPTTHSYGILYEFPTAATVQHFITLHAALENSRYTPELQPSLEERFQLVRDLSASVLHFHKVSWLQKSISSFNVGFFHPKEKPWLHGIGKPFFLGFLYSRHNGLGAFTEGPAEDAAHQNYQHPEYRKTKLRYRAEYDYYSLGFVLLEIGLWKSLGEIATLARP